MADLTKQEFANALRSIANGISALAATFDETAPPSPTYIITENGDRLRVIDLPGMYLIADPVPPEEE